jgi:hypothetical protein
MEIPLSISATFKETSGASKTMEKNPRRSRGKLKPL